MPVAETDLRSAEEPIKAYQAMKKKPAQAPKARTSSAAAEDVIRSSSTTSSSSLTVRTIRYGECQKNHAAGIGGYAVDGCREFMASGEEGTSLALVCAACGCHRSFHRWEVETAEVVSECSSAPTSNGMMTM